VTLEWSWDSRNRSTDAYTDINYKVLSMYATARWRWHLARLSFHPHLPRVRVRDSKITATWMKRGWPNALTAPKQPTVAAAVHADSGPSVYCSVGPWFVTQRNGYTGTASIASMEHYKVLLVMASVLLKRKWNSSPVTRVCARFFCISLTIMCLSVCLSVCYVLFCSAALVRIKIYIIT